MNDATDPPARASDTDLRFTKDLSRPEPIPEAGIARELALCFTTVALVTDLDAGVEGESGVTHDEVLQVFAQNIEGLKTVLTDAVAAMPETEPDEAAT